MKCRITEQETSIVITITRVFTTSDMSLPQKIEDYIYNPQHGETMMEVIDDPDDEMGMWKLAEIRCLACKESFSPNAIKSHIVED